MAAATGSGACAEISLPMKKPIKIMLEFSGWQGARLDDDGAMLRPPTAHEMAQAIAADIEQRAQAGGLGKFKVTVKPIP